jgi:hypothetical protein
MSKKIILLGVVMWLCSMHAVAQDIPAPKLTPVPQSEKHQQMLREAVALHDRGEYDGAISKYQQILSENPDDLLALYEMGFSFFAKGDYRKSMETAYKGAQYQSRFLSGFYVLIGNNFDHLNDHEKALKAYKAGIKLFPEDGQLYYNLAITYISLQKHEEAKQSLKDAVRFGPNHPSSHLGLSQLYARDNYKIPAMLALCRFLTLEARSRRAVAALQTLHEMTESGVSQGADGKNITITINPSAKTDEGDFNGASLALSLLSATRNLEKNKDKTEMQLLVDKFSIVFGVLAETSAEKKSSGFAWNYYRPYFAELKSRNLVEPFCYYIHQSANSAEVSKWLSQNAERVEQFLNWSQNYPWSTKR